MIKNPAFVFHRVTFMKKTFWTRSLFLLLVVLSNSGIAQTWEKLNPIFPVTDTLLQNTTVIFINKNVGWIITSGSPKFGSFSTKLFETKNGGLLWNLKINFNDGPSLYSTYVLNTDNFWFMGRGGDLVFSKNMGLNWDTSRVTYGNIYTSGYFFTTLYFFTDKKGIAFNDYRWYTSDGGYIWTKSEDTLTNFLAPTDVYFLNDSLGWIVSDINAILFDVGYIANTTNGGRTWAYQDSISHLMYGVDFIDSLKGYAVGTNRWFSNGYIYSTIDGGKNWEYLQYDNVGSFWDIRFLDNLNGWISGSGKILRTSDGGENWEIQVEGMQTDFRQLLILKKDKVAYALGKDWNGKTHTLLRADLSNLTEVISDAKILPVGYKLFQNYPNPFNPSTTLSYQIPSNSFVTLKVYDVLGNEVSTLVNEWQEVGSYNAQFPTSGMQLASGMYFYTLTAGKFTDTKKFILIK